MPNSDGSVSYWLARLHAGEDGAEDAIWRRFHRQLLGLAARVLPATACVEADEEDIVNIAFQSFFRRIGEGQFPDVRNRDDLSRLLTSITRRKAVAQIRRSRCHKRRQGSHDDSALPPLEQHPDPLPTPVTVALHRETITRMLAVLNDDLQQIALFKLEGLTQPEIAARIGRSIPTVERRLRLIRKKWEAAADAVIEE